MNIIEELTDLEAKLDKVKLCTVCGGRGRPNKTMAKIQSIREQNSMTSDAPIATTWSESIQRIESVREQSRGLPICVSCKGTGTRTNYYARMLKDIRRHFALLQNNLKYRD